MNNTKTILFCANRGYGIHSSRRAYVEEYARKGWRVMIACSSDAYTEGFSERGFEFVPITFERGGYSPIGDLVAFLKLLLLTLKVRPDISVFFNAKPVIFGALLGRILPGKKCKCVCVITGLGHAFVKGGIIRKLAGWGYKFGLKGADAVVFQNNDDFELFVASNWIDRERSQLISGSGVDTSIFSKQNFRENECGGHRRVLMLGRLIAQKGVREFLSVSNRVCEQITDTKFIWAGETDSKHPDSVPPSEFYRYSHAEFIGHCDNVAELLSQADVLLFPSYREGLPRAVMEAASMGLPVIAFDVPGVRDVIVNGETGYLVKFGDVTEMQHKLIKVLNDNHERERLGVNARKRMERFFDKNKIESAYLELLSKLEVS